MKISKWEKKKYLLPTKTDYEILEKIHSVEKIKNLNKDERAIIKFLRSQLKKDWRKPLLLILMEFLKNKKSEKRWQKIVKRMSKL